MPRFLLLGAGFSRNWGGWLASEVADDLLWRLRDSPRICEILMQASGFEHALDELQSRLLLDDSLVDDLLALDLAVQHTFRAMNSAFAQITAFNFSNFRQFSIIEFLAKFDAIFTLNQDLLLELHYTGVELTNPRRWTGIQWPGAIPPPHASPTGTRNGMLEFVQGRWGIAKQEPTIANNLQPIIKLHGSSNWYDDSSHLTRPLLVIGGQKQQVIDDNTLLRFYWRYFRECLHKDNALLMSIGYSFSDNHINKVICSAHEANRNFGLFVVDPNGKRVLDKRDTGAWVLPSPTPLMSVRYVGGSSRPLSSTFSDDNLEHAKLLRFFEE